ncbi:MAG: hypothetical protein QG597_1801 [Actinomycetota bacterium]|nr:hypothetical protein [Actinomycetota bacterium]
MPRNITDHGTPDRFVSGTIGMPGDRTFYLQSRQGADVVTVLLEKEQVSLLATKLIEMLDEVGRTDPEVADAEPAPEDLEPLETPVLEAFRVGAFGIGWDTTSRRVVIEIHAIADDVDVPDIGDDEAEGPDCLRVWLDAAEVRAFAQRSSALVASGRPPCPFCHLPLDPGGHICPRANGYRR